MKQVYLWCLLSCLPGTLESKSRLSKREKREIKVKIHRQSTLVKSARITIGLASCAIAAYYFKRAHPYVSTAIHTAPGGIYFFLTPANWWPLLKTCWFVSKLGTSAAMGAQFMPGIGTLDMNNPSHWWHADKPIIIADACMNATPWITAGISFGLHGIHNLYKATRSTEPKKSKSKLN